MFNSMRRYLYWYICSILGYAYGDTTTLNIKALLHSISPGIGSVEGITLITIEGNGFIEGDTTVTLGDSLQCTIESVTLSQLTCYTPATSEDTYPVFVMSGGTRFTGGESLEFEYSTLQTPSVSGISPIDGPAGTEVTITGAGFGDVNTVNIGDAECIVDTSNGNNNTSIVCTTGDHVAGTVNVDVNVYGKGAAVSNQVFNYAFVLQAVSPAIGRY